MNMNLSKNVSIILLIFSSSVLFFLFSSIFLTSATFLLGIPITPYHFVCTLIFTLGFVIISCFILLPRAKLINMIIILSSLILTFYISLCISSLFFDLSYDGQAYHQEALILLDKGWNPLYQHLSNHEANNMARPLNHYSKGVWIYEAMIFKTFKNIESAKLFHLWLMFAAFSLALSFLWQFIKLPYIFTSLIISALVAFNPVSIYQSLSFYLDGQLMSLMVILIVVLAFIYMKSNRYYLFLLLKVTSVLVNVKLTAGIYAVMMMTGYIILLWIKKKLFELYKFIIVATAALLIGFLFFGFSPYINNTISKGNPLYPALGTDRSEFTAPQFPANFSGKNSVSLLFYSIFAKSDNVRGPEKKAQLKIPFTFSKDELKAFTDTNAKQGGFGPLFGGTILLSFPIILAALVALWRKNRLLHQDKYLKEHGQHEANDGEKVNIGIPLFCLALILVTCLINPASSLARFVPQMWLFPIFAFFLACYLKNKPVQIIGYLIVLILLLNNFLIGITYYQYNLNVTNIYHNRLQKFAISSMQNPIKYYFGHFKSSSTLRFNKYGINYEIIGKKEDCHNGQRILPNSIILQCS